MRCPICDQPKVMYLPAVDAPNIGLYSCECGFEIEGPTENIVRAARPTHSPLSRPTPISLAPVGPLAMSSPYRR